MYYRQNQRRPEEGGDAPIDKKRANQGNTKIAKKTAHGLVWNFTAYGLSKAVVLLTLSILARLLSKEDFGLVAVAMVAVNFLSVFKDLGLGAALIQRRGDIEEAADTVFTLNLVIGFLLTAIVFPVAPFIAAYFGNPLVTPVLRWLGISFLINAVGSIHIVRLKRELDFRQKLIPDLGNAIVKGFVSIGMAFSGFGVWSLVFGQLTGAIASAVLAWMVLPWRPRIFVNRSIARGLLKYGASIMGADSVSIITENLAAIIVGRICGLALLGVYSLAYRLPEMLVISILWVMGGVVFPAFSAIQNEAKDMIKGFLATIRLIEIVAAPVCLGLFLAAEPIIQVLFGNQWVDAIPILRILAVYAWVYSIGFHVGAIYKAIGRADILFKLSVFTLVITFPALLIGARYGLMGIALGQLVVMIIRRTVGLSVATRFIDVTFFDILRELKPALQGGLFLAVFAVPALYFTADLKPIIRLVTVIIFGTAGYLGALWLSEKENLLHLLRVFNPSR